MGKEQYRQHSFLDNGIDVAIKPKPRRPVAPDKKIREAIAPYLDVPKLRQLASDHERLEEALKTTDIPEEISWLLSLLTTVLAPIERDQIRSPSDVASHLMLKMGHLCQEQFCCVCLNTKNRVQKIHTVYQGTIDTSNIRVAEVYREPMKLNSAAVLFAHNQPSSSVDPSPEDVLITRELVAAGKLLQIEPLDHLIIGRDKWVSLRKRGLGFDKP